MRALRVELRRSAALGAALVLFLLGLADFWFSTPAGWTSMTSAQRSALFLSWPLAVGAGAWQARRERMAGVGELFATSPRSVAQRLAPVAGALALAVVLAYLLVSLVGTAQVWRSPADVYFTVEGAAEIAVGAVSLIAAAWIGLWLGRLIPSAFTAPVVTALAFAATTVITELDLRRGSGAAFAMLLPAVELPYQRDHVQLPLDLSALQGLWLAGLAITAFGIATASGWWRRLIALVPAVATALILIPALPQGYSGAAFVANTAALRPVCTPDMPKVCVIKAHSGLLDEVTGPTRAALKALALLPDPPTSAMEVPEDATALLRPDGSSATSAPPEKPADPDVLPLWYQRDSKGHLDEPRLLTTYLLRMAWSATDCPFHELSSDEYDRFAAAQDIAGAWLAEQVKAATPESNFPQYYQPGRAAFSALPRDLQLRRIVAFRDAMLACGDEGLYTELTKAAT